MRDLWRGVVALSVLVTLSSWLGMPASAAEWLAALSWLPDAVSEPVARVMPAIIASGKIAATGIVLFYGAAIFLRFAGPAKRATLYMFLCMKGVVGMAVWMTKEEAAEIVERSDFFAVRRKTVDISRGPLAGLARAINVQPHYSREAILERRFVARLLREFEVTVLGATNDGKYCRELLIRWLDALIDKEVDDQMGKIPNVYIEGLSDAG